MKEFESIIFKKDVTRKAQKCLEQFLDSVERTNKEMVRREKLPVVSQTEEQDIRMDIHKKGWFKYWKKRLVGETEILPESVQQIIKKLHSKESLDDDERTKFAHHVSKRIGVLKLNTVKRLEMAELKQRLQDIDKKEDYPESEIKQRKTIFCRGPENKLFVKEDGLDKEDKKITFGDIVADHEWGIKYRPDKSVPERTWRKIRKLSDFTEAKTNIEKIFNIELSRIEHVSLSTTNISEEFLEKNSNRGDIEGIFAERMAKNFLIRVQYNNPDLGLEAESSNAVEDAELKYDFKIMTQQKRRGVAIEGEEVPRDKLVAAKRRIGIQFTTTENPVYIEKKEKQVSDVQAKLNELKLKYQDTIKRPVDDIVLVALHLGTYRQYFKTWLKDGKPSGGPEQYLSREEKIKLLKETTKNFLDLPETEIEKLDF